MTPEQIEQLRPGFEAWYVDAANKATGMGMTVKDMPSKRGVSGNYQGYDYLHGCWIGWLGSRETMVVELPSVQCINLNEYGTVEVVDVCKAAVIAAGGTVKS
jgi:hypothetical protein